MKYKLKSLKIWGVGDTNFEKQDFSNATLSDDGEYLMSIHIEGYGEPIDFRSLRIPKAGETLEGEVIEYTTKKGLERMFFKEGKDQPSTQDYIQSQWAMGQALSHMPDHMDLESIQGYAEALIETVNKIVRK